MKIYKFNEYCKLNENSKNDPIPEIKRITKNLGIILMGTPGIGKSTFIENKIKPFNKDIKSFSTDDVSLLFTKNPNYHYNNSSVKNKKRLSKYIENGGNFIFDQTGMNSVTTMELVDKAIDNNYTIIFIHLVGTLDKSIEQNMKRNRNIDEDYIRLVYDNQHIMMNKYKNKYKNSKYYIVYNKDGDYRYYLKEEDKLLKRKNDKYI